LLHVFTEHETEICLIFYYKVFDSEYVTFIHFDENSSVAFFLLTEMTRGVVFACEIIEDSEGPGTGVLGPDFIRIRIRGQSFMLQ
jgi:hypothetical protein